MTDKRSTDELLLVTLAGRASPRRDSRTGLARLVALFVGIAVALLLARADSARAAGLGSFMPEGLGISISLPLGDATGQRPTMSVFAVMDDLGPGQPAVGLPVQRMAFLDIGTVGGLVGVSSWPAKRIATAPRLAPAAAATSKPVTKAPANFTGAIRNESRSAMATPRTSMPAARIRQMARRATVAYQQLRQRYVAGRHGAERSVAREHARLVKAYRIALEWRRYAGIE